MTRHHALGFVVLLVALGWTALVARAPAQDSRKDVAKQKTAAAANLKKADLGKTSLVESKYFLVATTLPEDRAKAIGAVLDRVVPLARRALRFEEKEEAWKGKLAVYFLPDSRDFNSFIRSVVGMQPSGLHYDLRSDDPFIVGPADGPGGPGEAELSASSAALVAGAYLKARGGTATLPDWLVGGFGRVSALRADGTNSRRYQAYRTAARTLARNGARPTELWGDARPANADVLANSFADYLAFGPGAGNFPKLIAGFRPDENGNVPGPQAAFEAAGWKDLALLEAAWKKWAVSNK